MSFATESTESKTKDRRQPLTCLVCGTATQGACPADMPPGDFGPRLQATTGYLRES
ncbi:MAG: hypothetical protein KGJ80_15485 [Chloroflexota bacterium]|nr:hypothetical protein [Chloroflexota bacterium]